MKSILISIKPKFVKKIVDGEKKFEFRKRFPKSCTNIRKLLIYSSWPVKKVVAECDIDDILYDTPENIWTLTSSSSGLTKDSFDMYFDGKDIAYAIKIKNLTLFKKPKDLNEYGILRAPQSYQYLIE